MFNKRAKPRLSQRSRSEVDTDPNDKEDKEDDTSTDSPATLAAKFKAKAKKSRPKSRLSFGGDEEASSEETFKLKKSNLSVKMTLGKNAANIPTSFEQASISPTKGPTYDAAHLNQLKASTQRRPVIDDPYDADMSMDISMDIADVSMDVDSLEETLIPTESSIKNTKDRRERLRKSGVSSSDDFISLSVSRQEDVPQGPHPDSRLVREEDELGEGDDEFAEYTSAQERIALGKKSRKVEATKKRNEMQALIDDAEEIDEETIEWENEQVRRAGHGPSEASQNNVKLVYKAAPIPPPTPIPTLASSISRLSQQLIQLTSSHAASTSALSTLAQQHQEVDDREKEMRDLVIKAEEKRAWFQSFREWLESVAGFLDEKYPTLEKLEEEHLSLLRERRDMVDKRRQLDDEDDLSYIFGSLPVEPVGDDIEQTDSFGRLIPKPSPAILKIQRRKARIARHSKMTDTDEGYFTDSEISEEDEQAYRSAKAELSLRLKEVLADVKAEEFLDPGKGRWGSWREQYEDTYVGAWGGLGVVSVWEFWARLELAGWDCVENSQSLDTFRWYHGLYEYSRPEGDNGDLGTDGDLVSSMVSTALIPRLAKIIDNGALDVYSESHMRRVVDLAEEVEASLDEGNTKIQMLLKSVVNAFEKAISQTEQLLAKYAVLSQQAVTFDPEAIPARRRFLTRRYKLVKNLLRWRKHTGERFGAGQLVSRLLEGCMWDLANNGREVGGDVAIRQVVAILPEELVPTVMKQRINMR